MLAASPTPGAEEYGIFDYEGFGPVRIGEYESLDTVSMIGQGIAEHGMAYAHWTALVGTADLEEAAEFEDAYLGRWDSVKAYAEELLDDFGIERDITAAVPEHLQPYVNVDVEGFARDLELGGDIRVSTGHDGVYIFDGRF
jgi:antirestriction protein